MTGTWTFWRTRRASNGGGGQSDRFRIGSEVVGEDAVVRRIVSAGSQGLDTASKAESARVDEVWESRAEAAEETTWLRSLPMSGSSLRGVIWRAENKPMNGVGGDVLGLGQLAEGGRGKRLGDGRGGG